MTDKEIYRIWAPIGKKWTDWVRPVPFIGIKELNEIKAVTNQMLPVVTFMDDIWNPDKEDFAMILDLPGGEGVRFGVALAKLGFRPIPVYNGTNPQKKARSTVDNKEIGIALKCWAEELEKIKLSDSARPVFLLDSNRLNRYKMDETIYDNSWDIYPQDLPSAQFFLDNGINKILIVGRKKLAEDLRKILDSHHKKGIAIYHTDGCDKADRVCMTKKEYIFRYVNH